MLWSMKRVGLRISEMRNDSIAAAGSMKPGSRGRLLERNGITRIELALLLALLVLVATLVLPALLTAREMARRSSCAYRMKQLGAALQQYHASHQYLPPAAIWKAPDGLQSLMLNQNRRIDLITHENWVQLLLPSLDRAALAQSLHSDQPIGDDVNQRARTTRLPELTCGSDSYNTSANPYRFELDSDSGPQVEFARGNYAINLGTQCHRSIPGTSDRPAGDGVEIEIDEERRSFQYTGTGIAGINRCYRLSDFDNGLTTLVALDEVRSGIHPLDPRGVWSLGQIGGSITSAHGVSGDDYAPNRLWDRADDVLGCGRLHDAVGSETLLTEQMPCAHYIDRNDQATARSLHPDGVNVLFVDGTVRFIKNSVDRGLWHVMHSRETPASVLADDFVGRLEDDVPPADALPQSSTSTVQELRPGDTFQNSLGISFVALPGGEYQMGMPDQGNGGSPPPECPVHPVRISRAFWMGQHEVTQHDYETVMGVNPSYHRESASGDSDSGRLPVEQVTWHDAAEFCRRLSQHPEEQAAGRRYRLPTEAEWEYACRAGRSEPYDWRSAAASQRVTGESGGLPVGLPVTAVGSFPPNSFGLYDMRGNVWEWCADWFDRTYYSRSPKVDPQGPQIGYLKVLRGSDWIFVGEVCRINYPILPPTKSNRFVGFRVVCVQETGLGR